MKGKISAAKLTKCGTHSLGKDLLERVKNVSKENKEKEDKKVKAEALAYHVIAKKSKLIRDKHGDDPATMNIKEMRAVLMPLRSKDEPAVPNKRAQLLVKYNEWKDRAYKEVIVLDNAEEDDDAGAEVSGDCGGNGDEQEEEQQVVVPLPIAEQVIDVYESGAVSEENKLMM